ncbi:hypothetical protein Vadar_007109 [Vaccinium darrowii]|uniref:Uncharacterized protein n=1 Tax=Vaccinium darrowii TaxID=229202 RepID=A0ACB7XY88_9ERIC|nr:hypothetical protein Vadar_007109 [Vaccinium darrowii]
MNEEIFGPLLLIITLQKIEDSIEFMKSRPRPLTIYAFTKNEKLKRSQAEEREMHPSALQVLNPLIFRLQQGLSPPKKKRELGSRKREKKQRKEARQLPAARSWAEV